MPPKKTGKARAAAASNNNQPAQEVECTICLSAIEGEIGLLRCKHSFCYPCIESWGDHENTCPLCKRRFNYIDKGNTNEPKAKKERVKIKKKDQGDIHRPIGGLDGGDLLFARFIASLVESRHHLMHHPILPSGYAPPRVRFFHGSANAPRSRNHVGSTAANPIDLIDESATTQQNSSSNASNDLHSQLLVDLTREEQQAAAVGSNLGANIHSGAMPGYRPWFDVGTPYDFDEDEEDDEFFPFFSDCDSFSGDSDNDGSDTFGSTIADRYEPHRRTSGGGERSEMLWCNYCEDFHEKSTLLGDRTICPLMFDSLLAQQPTNESPSSSSSASSQALNVSTDGPSNAASSVQTESSSTDVIVSSPATQDDRSSLQRKSNSTGATSNVDQPNVKRQRRQK